MAAKSLTPSYLRAVLSYEPTTGIFQWRQSAPNKFRGCVAGWRHNQGYLGIRISGRHYLAHRLAWLYVYGRWPDQQIDHINGNRADNRICNLRECSNAQNCQNVRSHKDGISKFVGVCHDGRKWLAQLTVNGHRVLLARFDTEAAAAAAYLEAKSKWHTFTSGPSQNG